MCSLRSFWILGDMRLWWCVPNFMLMAWDANDVQIVWKRWTVAATSLLCVWKWKRISFLLHFGTFTFKSTKKIPWRKNNGQTGKDFELNWFSTAKFARKGKNFIIISRVLEIHEVIFLKAYTLHVYMPAFASLCTFHIYMTMFPAGKYTQITREN